MASAELRIEVVYSAAAGRVWCWQGTLPAGSRLEEALRLSGLLTQHPEIDVEHAVVGLWGRVTVLSRELSDGDRVEVYRPLLVDPKEARRLRYKRQRGIAEVGAVAPRR